MYSRTTLTQAEQLAKKHGQAANQRSSFKYLMKEKTYRSGKSNDEKQNQENSTILSVANKFVMPLQQHRVETENKDVEFSIIPLSNCLENKRKTSSIPPYSQAKKTIEKEDVIEFLKEFQKKKVLVEMGSSSINANVESSQIACMTEDCYYQKELQIKISLLQRERDQLWDSITGIVKENMTLKEMMANLTINTEVIKREEASTEMAQIQTAEIDTQTQMTGEDIQTFEKELIQSNSSITQTIDFCKTICFEDEQYGQMQWKNLKDAVCQCINSKITISYSQFEAESAILVQLNEHLQQKLKESTEITSKIIAQKAQEEKKFAQKEGYIEEKLQQMLLACQEEMVRKQRQLNKEINHLHNKIAANEQVYQDRIQELTSIKDQQCKNAQAEVKITKQLLEKSKQGWEQRQKLFSTLLAEAHKTINGLMDQMKDFESQANANYSKHLKSQRVQWGIQHHSE